MPGVILRQQIQKYSKQMHVYKEIEGGLKVYAWAPISKYKPIVIVITRSANYVS